MIIFVASNHNFQENAYLYVASLAVADLLVGLFYSFHVMDHIFAITENNVICKLQISVLVSFTISSILNMVAVGMERYLRIANPFLHASWRGKRFNVMVLVIIWTIAIISGTLPLFMFNYNSSEAHGMCNIEDYLPWWYTATYLFGIFLLSATILFICHCKIIYIALQQSIINNFTANGCNDKEKRLENFLNFVSCSWIISYMLDSFTYTYHLTIL